MMSRNGCIGLGVARSHQLRRRSVGRYSGVNQEVSRRREKEEDAAQNSACVVRRRGSKDFVAVRSKRSSIRVSELL